ncbi:MAG: ABC transporter ATP-binding protein, partial [Bacteroidaceae bacterium]|nr:ABC transporter ATP-binding protein [Bacteroidaceae bacterium]
MKYTTKQIARLTWQELKANKLQATNNTLAGLLIVALEFLFVWLTKQTIDIATGASHVFTLRTAVILLIATLMAQLLLTAYRSWVNAMLSVKATNRMQLDIFRRTLITPWTALLNFHSGDIINRIEKDVSVIVTLVTDTLPAFIIVSAQFIGAFTFLYLMDHTLALFVVIIIPFFILIGKLYIKTMRRLSRQIRKTDSQLQAQYQEGITNRIVVKSIPGATQEILQRTLKTQSKMVRLVHNRARYSITSNFIINFGFAAAYLFTFIWGTYHLSIGLITYGALIAFVQLVAQIQRPARSLAKFIPDLISALTSGERLLQIKELEQDIPLDNTQPNTESTEQE